MNLTVLYSPVCSAGMRIRAEIIRVLDLTYMKTGFGFKGPKTPNPDPNLKNKILKKTGSGSNPRKKPVRIWPSNKNLQDTLILTSRKKPWVRILPSINEIKISDPTQEKHPDPTGAATLLQSLTYSFAFSGSILKLVRLILVRHYMKYFWQQQRKKLEEREEKK